MKGSIREAVILAGGFGTRLLPVVKDLPKSMALVKGRPFIQYLFDWLLENGISKAVLSVGYLHQVFIDYFGSKYLGLNIEYAIEDIPLGTGGATGRSLSHCEGSDVLVINGDTYFPVPLESFFIVHHRSNAAISLALKNVDNAKRYGTVRVNASNQVVVFLEKQSAHSGLINSGVYLIKKDWFNGHFPSIESYSLEKFIFPIALAEARLYGFPFDLRFIDIGIPEDYRIANELFF